jgi:AbrB family looped-hinge helix DNA binding protein
MPEETEATMRKKKNVVRRISLDTARALLADIRTMSLEKAGNRHGIRNHETIPRLISRTFEREGKKVPKILQKKAAAGRSAQTVTVNKKGTIVLPKEIVSAFGLKTGQTLSTRKHGAKIVLDIAPRPRKMAAKKAAKKTARKAARKAPKKAGMKRGRKRQK